MGMIFFALLALALIVAVFFGVLLLSVAMYVYKVNKRYRLRKMYADEEDDLYFTHRGQPAHYYGPTSTELKYLAAKKYNAEPESTVRLLNNQIGVGGGPQYNPLQNGKTHLKNNLDKNHVSGL